MTIESLLLGQDIIPAAFQQESSQALGPDKEHVNLMVGNPVILFVTT